MNIVRIFLACAVLATCGLASAQYQWVDKDGRKIFSDRPPPADIPQKNVLKQPRGASRIQPSAPPMPAPESTTENGSQEAAPSAPTPALATKTGNSAPGVDKALEDKKKQAEAAEAARKKEEEQKLAAQRAENCKRALSVKAGLDSGVRIARTNEKGERQFLDDAERAAEMQRVQAIIQSDCK